MRRPLPYAPVRACRVCGAPVDPLVAADLGGVCGRLRCRAEVAPSAEDEAGAIEARRRLRARERLMASGTDPDAVPWRVVPWNPAREQPLEADAVADWRAHFRRVWTEAIDTVDVRAAEPAPPGEPDPETAGAIARACAACRGWCCRRGGTHAFLDVSSVRRVAAGHPEWGRDAVEALYLDHLGETRLEDGCVFQGPAGCRLPRSLRSDTCNRWLCPDLAAARRAWERGDGAPEATRFVAVPPGRS